MSGPWGKFTGVDRLRVSRLRYSTPRQAGFSVQEIFKGEALLVSTLRREHLVFSLCRCKTNRLLIRPLNSGRPVHIVSIIYGFNDDP